MAELFAYRFANWDTPLWVLPNRRAGRFNKPNSPPTQYLSLHPVTPMAEYMRREGYRRAERLLEIRARVWVVRIRRPSAARVTFDNAAEFGLEPHDLVNDDYGACQDFADRCRTDKNMPEAIVVPSAALPGTSNLVIFGPRVLLPYELAPSDDVDVPGSVVADGAHPLLTLPSVVRYVGDAHPAFEAWARGEEFNFSTPSYRVSGNGV